MAQNYCTITRNGRITTVNMLNIENITIDIMVNILVQLKKLLKCNGAISLKKEIQLYGDHCVFVRDFLINEKLVKDVQIIY